MATVLREATLFGVPSRMLLLLVLIEGLSALCKRQDPIAIDHCLVVLTYRNTAPREEMFLSKLSLENITAHLYSCPGCGCNNFYIWNYQKQEVRDFWANGTARLFNEAGAEASQWDGTDMLDGWGWGLPHSKNTWSAGYGRYWQMSADSA
jgi:hypothetical protein